MNADDARDLAALISAVGTDQLGQALDRALRQRVDFDMSCVYLFRFNHPALLVHNGYNRSVPERTLAAYQRGGYLLDPFYVACINDHPGGLWRMSELAPDCFFSSGFSISPDIHPCVSSEHGTLVEEIGFIVPLQPRVALVYSLMRNLGDGPFSTEEMQTLEALTPVVHALLELHGRVRHGDSFAYAETSDARSEDAFMDILQGQLTEAQRYIAKLILQGHSSASIAALLGISEGTVKVHKHNIYQRLEISNNADLFRLFIDYLTRLA
ncbi:helix-turn-helix transcriptional regulator [Pseudomonas sp. DTU_2021_1001937_2_SI_NGA_ILE_001]|uniref:helix-turn-helix domain-containing protein n=1 Tax=Pseudomonas sp. DTU_2021_1001937_2_SI_NGA_ILE_001 TaxID=3077589 RepID=UPI0025CD1EF8|nr:helix-turn-helix transcriptional regulator [Pseudomonas sp. DTU_2021_1001937_2_SI_NGA_ILE_001]WNW14262.1 helix-turn-helix transcriptional regulator [Pseudomonas sp. DTU_2021_1001937_2_SI_NGA_ILE_001]